jgi:hypothetical protein
MRPSGCHLFSTDQRLGSWPTYLAEHALLRKTRQTEGFTVSESLRFPTYIHLSIGRSETCCSVVRHAVPCAACAERDCSEV